MDNWTSCSLCMESYESYGQDDDQKIFREPRVLTCGHTFCNQCIHNLRATSVSGVVQCPIDRRPSKSDAKNYEFWQLLQHYHHTVGQHQAALAQKQTNFLEAVRAVRDASMMDVRRSRSLRRVDLSLCHDVLCLVLSFLDAHSIRRGSLLVNWSWNAASTRAMVPQRLQEGHRRANDDAKQEEIPDFKDVSLGGAGLLRPSSPMAVVCTLEWLHFLPSSMPWATSWRWPRHTVRALRFLDCVEMWAGAYGDHTASARTRRQASSTGSESQPTLFRVAILRCPFYCC